jgi:hypothetical protein
MNVFTAADLVTGLLSIIADKKLLVSHAEK